MDDTKAAALDQLGVRMAGISAMRKAVQESVDEPDPSSADHRRRSRERDHLDTAVADSLELLIREMHRAWELGASKAEIADAVGMTERQVEAQLD
jgi:transcriptional regulator GlxA family with amidase domain